MSTAMGCLPPASIYMCALLDYQFLDSANVGLGGPANPEQLPPASHQHYHNTGAAHNICFRYR